MIEIRKFRHAEAAMLADFIDTHWQRGHVLARHRGLLDWQHLDGDEYAYLGAWRDAQPLAILGYIPTRRFDASLANPQDNVLWLALWKLRADADAAGLGLRLLGELGRIEPNAAVGVVGINPEHLPMYRAMRFETGDLRQYVLFRRGAVPRLASWPQGRALPVGREGRATLRELDAGELEGMEQRLQLGERAAVLPRKTGGYFATRYLRHPFYRYRVHALEQDGAVRGLVASRLATHESDRALRLVDCLADPLALAQAGGAFDALLEASGAEYADLWQHGLHPAVLQAAGFEAVDADGDVIVPTLFEPFVRQNRRLQFAFKARDGRGCVLMRADGDQDRPNRLEPAP